MAIIHSLERHQPFPTKSVRLDWKLIAGIDVDRVQRIGVAECGALQDTLVGVAFCDVSAEFPETKLPQGLVKVFRIAQLTIQYLLHSQETLTDAIEKLQSDNGAVAKECKSLARRCKSGEREIQSLKLELKRRKKVIQVQQDCIYHGKDPGSFQKCPWCPKTFVNQSYLDSHVNRRHKDQKCLDAKNHSTGDFFRGKGSNDAQENIHNDCDESPRTKKSVVGNNEEKEIEAAAVQKEVADESVKAKTQKLLLEMIRRELSQAKDTSNEGDSRTSRTTAEVHSNNNLPSGAIGPIEELRFIVKRQELEIQSMRENLNQSKLERDREEGKLSSQERFWQARLMSADAAHKAEMAGIREQLNKLQSTTQLAKDDLLRLEQQQHQRQLRQQQEAKNKSVTKAQDLPNGKWPCPTTDDVVENMCLEPPLQDNDHDKLQCLGEDDLIPKKESKPVSVLRMNSTDNNANNTEVVTSPPPIHEYASIQSLLEELERCTSVDDLAEENPSFLRPYRQDACSRFETLLEEQFGIHSVDKEGIDDEQLSNALAQLKETRKKRDNGDKKVLATLRKQCREEVEELVGQANISTANNGTSLLGKRMSSIRKRLLSSWRRKKSSKPKYLSEPPLRHNSENKTTKATKSEPPSAEPVSNLYVECPTSTAKQNCWTTTLSAAVPVPAEKAEYYDHHGHQKQLPVPAPRIRNQGDMSEEQGNEENLVESIEEEEIKKRHAKPDKGKSRDEIPSLSTLSSYEEDDPQSSYVETRQANSFLLSEDEEEHREMKETEVLSKKWEKTSKDSSDDSGKLLMSKTDMVTATNNAATTGIQRISYDDDESEWDEDQGQEASVEIHQPPQQSEEEEEEEYIASTMKLKQTRPGSRIDELKNTIEQQMKEHRRKREESDKLAAAEDEEAKNQRYFDDLIEEEIRREESSSSASKLFA